MISSLEDPQNCGEAELATNDQVMWLKKKRPQRACDSCRRKKVRCDGHQSSENSCSQCITHNSSCTYLEARKPTDHLERHIEYLENKVRERDNKVEELEQLLRELLLDNGFFGGLNRFQESPQTKTSLGSAVESFPNSALNLPPQSASTSTYPMAGPHFREEEDENTAHQLLALHDDTLSNLSEHRYHGKSSCTIMVQLTMQYKQQCTGNTKAGPDGRAVKGRRLEHWNPRPWESLSDVCDSPNFVFPPHDLLLCLVDLYFERINLFYPLIHKPSFRRSITQGLHNSDPWFGAVLLLVCAIGSQYSDDHRVLIEGDPTYHSSGWKWFEQVKCTIMRRDDPGPCSLHNLQLYCLAVRYLQNKTIYGSCWIMLGNAIRLAQDGGIHLKCKADTESWTLEDELKTRAFWVLLVMDIGMSCTLGRSCTTLAEDFDLDYPLDVDDEHLERAWPKQTFRKLKGKPSPVTAFNSLIKLYQVRAFALQKLYRVKNGKRSLASAGNDSNELASMLNDWADSVPEHLRWDPERKNTDHFKQSVVLYMSFYYVQILIYRPFIPLPGKSSRYPSPSVDSCTNVARLCCNVLHAMRKRQLDVLPFAEIHAFTAGLVLLLNIWDGKRHGRLTDPHKDMLDVYKCIEVLRVVEKRWDSAGRLYDVLNELLPAGNPSPTDPSPSSSQEKGKQPIYQGPTPGPSADSIGLSRANAGSKRVSRGMVGDDIDPGPSQWNPPFFPRVDNDAAYYGTGQFNYQREFLEYSHPQIPTLGRTDTIPVGMSSTATTVPSLYTRMPASPNQVQDWPISRIIGASESNTFGAFSTRPSASSSISGWAGESPQRSLRQPQLLQPQPRLPITMLQMQHQLAPQTYNDTIDDGFTDQEGQSWSYPL